MCEKFTGQKFESHGKLCETTILEKIVFGFFLQIQDTNHDLVTLIVFLRRTQLLPEKRRFQKRSGSYLFF